MSEICSEWCPACGCDEIEIVEGSGQYLTFTEGEGSEEVVVDAPALGECSGCGLHVTLHDDGSVAWASVPKESKAEADRNALAVVLRSLAYAIDNLPDAEMSDERVERVWASLFAIKDTIQGKPTA